MLSAFYGAFSPACFSLLGLWLVAVSLRLKDWEKKSEKDRYPQHKRRSYGVALLFALPGVMSALALIDVQTSAFWRVSFFVVALGGVVVMASVRGYPVRPESGHRGFRGLPLADRLGLAAYVVAIVLYVLIGVLAVVGGTRALRAEAVLLTLLVFLGFNVAWLLLLDERADDSKHPDSQPSAQTQ
jgi:peptidoglycan/LPS O-acetylase OafA/YrhL